MGFTKTAAKGFTWISAFRFANRAISFVRIAILARLLTPTQFGDYAIAILVLAFVEILTETGINIFLIQHREQKAIHKYLNTAWVVSIIRGIIIGSLIAIAAIPIGYYYHSKSSIILIFLISFVPLIRGFINPAVIYFQKSLRFDQEFFYRLTISLADLITAIILVFIYHHPFGLVLGLIVAAIIEVIISHHLVHPKPTIEFNHNHFKEIFHSGKWMTLAGIGSYIATNLTDISIGKLLSTTSLGLYQMAYKFSGNIIYELSEIFNKIAFPIYTQIKDDTLRLRQAFIKTYLTHLGIGLFSMILVTLTADVFVPILLGSNWTLIINIIEQLALVSSITIFAAPIDPLLLATNNQKKLSFAVFIQALTLTIGIACILPHPSIDNFIAVLTLSTLTSLPLRFFWTLKILNPLTLSCLAPRISKSEVGIKRGRPQAVSLCNSSPRKAE